MRPYVSLTPEQLHRLLAGEPVFRAIAMGDGQFVSVCLGLREAEKGAHVLEGFHECDDEPAAAWVRETFTTEPVPDAS